MNPAFITGKPILVRLSATAAAALGVAEGEDIPLHDARTVDGWLQADYRHADGALERYLLPPGSVLYLHQLHTREESGADIPEPAVMEPR